MPGPGRNDRGSATAELAVALPALTLMLFTGLTAVGAVTTKLRCVDTARDVALAAARGESVDGDGVAGLPAGATVTVSVTGDRVVATVRAPIRSVGVRVPGWTVVVTATAAVEPGALVPGGGPNDVGPGPTGTGVVEAGVPVPGGPDGVEAGGVEPPGGSAPNDVGLDPTGTGAVEAGVPVPGVIRPLRPAAPSDASFSTHGRAAT